MPFRQAQGIELRRAPALISGLLPVGSAHADTGTRLIPRPLSTGGLHHGFPRHLGPIVDRRVTFDCDPDSLIGRRRREHVELIREEFGSAVIDEGTSHLSPSSVLSRGGERLEGESSSLNSAMSRVEKLPSPLNLIVHGDELCQMTSIPLHNSFVGHLVAPGIKARSISGPVFGTCRCVLQKDKADLWTAPAEINLNAAQFRLYETIPGAAERSSAEEDLLLTLPKNK